MSLRWTAILAAPLVALACSASGTASHGGGPGSGGNSGATSDGGGGSGGSGATSTGGGKVGDACKTDSDCSDPPDAKCFTTIGSPQFGTVTFPGGYCSKDCGGDGGNGCGTSGGCTDFGSSGGGTTLTLTMCTAPCKTNADCRTADGYRCQLLIPGFGYCSP